MKGTKDADHKHDAGTFEGDQACSSMVAAGLKPLMPRYKAVFANVMQGAEIQDIVATLKDVSGDLLKTVENPLLAPFVVVIHAACNEMTNPKRVRRASP